MIELSDNKDENIQIRGKAQRYNHWYMILMEMENVVGISKEYPIKNQEELEKIDVLIAQLQSLKSGI
jgi:hypothetical protein